MSYDRHEIKKTAHYNNFLLSNISLPIDITLVSTPNEVSTPSLLITEALHKTNTFSSDKSRIAKIENYIDQTVLNHLKSQILTEIENELDINNTNIEKKMRFKILGITITTF